MDRSTNHPFRIRGQIGEKLVERWRNVSIDQCGSINRIQIVKSPLFNCSRQAEPRGRKVDRLTGQHRLNASVQVRKGYVTRDQIHPASDVIGNRVADSHELKHGSADSSRTQGAAQNHIRTFPQFGHFDDEFPIVQVSKKPGLAGLLLEFRWQWQLRWIECLLGILPQIKSGPGLYRYQRTIGKKKPDGTVFSSGQNRFFFDFFTNRARIQIHQEFIFEIKTSRFALQ